MRTRLLFVPILIACAGAGARAQAQPAAEHCRAFAAAAAHRTTGPGLSLDVMTACRYDKTTNKSTCTHRFTDARRVSSTSVSVTTFASIADAIDEVRVLPPIRRSLRTETTVKDAQGTTTTTLVNAYDRQRRLVQEVGTSSRGTKYTTTYTSWDSAGRPTSGATVRPGGRDVLTLTYRDTPPTLTISTSSLGLRAACSQIFDTHGNPSSTTCTGNTNSKTSFTVSKLEQICQ